MVLPESFELPAEVNGQSYSVKEKPLLRTGHYFSSTLHLRLPTYFHTSDGGMMTSTYMNSSRCYIGRTRDVPEEAVDQARGVGESIQVEWGNILWNAVVIGIQPAPSPLDLVLPAKQLRERPLMLW